MTPIIGMRGLKIRLVSEYCEDWAYQNGCYLSSVTVKLEKFATLRSWLVFLFGIAAFLLRMDRIVMSVAVFSIVVFCTFGMLYRPFFYICRVLDFTQPHIVSGLTGWFLDKIILIVLAPFTIGWIGLLYLAIGYISGLIIGFLIMSVAGAGFRHKYGINLTDVERAFIMMLLSLTRSSLSPTQWVHEYAIHLYNQRNEGVSAT